MKILISLISLLFLSFNLYATHIIGGYMTYEQTATSQYEIHLVVYRDCINGVPPFDDPAAVGVFDASGILVQTLSLFVNDSVNVFIQGPCIPGNICLRKANYYYTINLGNGGPYTFAYQRCCRSLTVLNLLDPANTGMTFYCVIDPSVNNNAAQFKHEMAAFTYVGDNLSFDGSAIDIDGDSLVYSLDDATSGASQGDPMPAQPSPPPYLSIPWQPPYSLNNIIGGTTPLNIDSQSGIITGIPSVLGVFIVAEKVDEYRNGSLINSIRKEFVLTVNPANYFDVSGTAFTNGTTQPLDFGKAWMIRLNLIDSILTAVDTNDITNGTYLDAQAINGIYLAKVSADTNSIFYNQSIPTYYGDVLFWYDASNIVLCQNNISNIDINMIQGNNPGGPGFIGGLISQGANRLAANVSTSVNLEGITIILFNQLNQPVAYDVTDINGNFAIGNLPLGDYKIYVDRLNYYVDNNIAPIVSVSSATSVMNNLLFSLHNSWLELLGTVGVDEVYGESNFVIIFPNPASSELVVKINADVSEVKFKIYNMFGVEITEGKINSDVINIENLAPQVYLLRIENKQSIQYFKFVKK